MSKSSVTYDALAIDGLQTILTQVSQSCDELGIDFFVVGAIARNVWFAAHGERAMGTKDIDFAVCVASHADYAQLKEALISRFEYYAIRDNPFSLLSPDHKQIDLLPFGEIEQEGQVMMEGRGLTSIKLEGFNESYSLGLVDAQIGEHQVKVCSIPAIVILKLIAYDDRPERRIKDAKDVDSICRHYPTIESEYIWANHFDLYTEDRTHDQVAMMVLGREMRGIVGANEMLRLRLIRILENAVHGESDFLRHMVVDAERETLAEKKEVLTWIKSELL